MIVKFFNLSKRTNSTKRPTDAGASYNCLLKEDTSIIAPVITLEMSALSVPHYNYAFIQDFGRYYHINDIHSDGRHWHISMAVDVLATYRYEIGQADLYILRSTAAYDGSIIDTFYPMKTGYNFYSDKFVTPWVHWELQDPAAIDWQLKVRDGTFVLGVVAIPENVNAQLGIDRGQGSYGSIKYIMLSQSNMYTLIDYLMGNNIWNNTDFDIDGATMSVTKSIINPLSYIKSCLFLPIKYVAGNELQTVKIWDWDVNVPCYLLGSDPSHEYTQRIQVRRHPQAASRGAYLNVSPYSEYSLVYPPFGIIELDPVEIQNCDEIELVAVVDFITGAGRLDIYNTVYVEATEHVPAYWRRNKLIARTKCQVSVPVQLSEVGYDYSNIGATAVGVGAGFLGNFLSGFGSANESGLTSAVSKIGSLANNMRQRVSSTGGNGNFSELDGVIDFRQTFFQITNEDFDHVGRPLCAIRKASSGAAGDYWLAREGDLPLEWATFAERDEVKSYLEGGFFWE